MKVRFLGIGFEHGDGVSIDELLYNLTSNNGAKTKLGSFDRQCYLKALDGRNSNYIVGLLVTIKDHKKFCELQNSDGKFIVKVSTVNANSNLMDFNFFAINKTNGQCLYQHYHNSCSSSQFAQFLQSNYKRLQAFKAEADKSAIEDITKKQTIDINKKYKKGLSWGLMVRPENFDALLAEMETIRDFQMDFEALHVPEPDFAPLKNMVKKERRKISFVADTKASLVSQAIAKIIKNEEITEGKITGRGPDGLEKVIHILDNPDNFGEYDYDDVAGKINALDVDDFYKNWVITELLNQMKRHDYIFEAEIEP